MSFLYHALISIIAQNPCIYLLSQMHRTAPTSTVNTVFVAKVLQKRFAQNVEAEI